MFNRLRSWGEERSLKSEEDIFKLLTSSAKSNRLD